MKTSKGETINEEKNYGKGILAVFTCIVLALSAPLAYAAEQEVSSQEESENEFQIENGVLIKYIGNN